MNRREFIAGLGSAAVWPVLTRAQQPTTKVSRIGWLATGSPISYRFSLGAFLNGLRALGYADGENIRIEYRWAEGDVARLPKLADELVDNNVDLIVAGGSVGAEAAKHATPLIPIVAAGVGDLVELGLVPSLARPGTNLTGFVANAPEGAAKRFQIINEIIPRTKRSAILWNPTSSNAVLEWAEAEKFAIANDIVIAPYAARDMFTYRKIIVDAAYRFRLPSIYGFREFVDDGGLISYGVSISDTYRRAASYVVRILRGEKPGDLPVQLPTKFELVINLRIANALGLIIPETLLATADEVIQ
jgi:putative tryptophan/tyrosine transport system substrate-binding protein